MQCDWFIQSDKSNVIYYNSIFLNFVFFMSEIFANFSSGPFFFIIDIPLSKNNFTV